MSFYKDYERATPGFYSGGRVVFQGQVARKFVYEPIFPHLRLKGLSSLKQRHAVH
jgi:hypothetical protein